ncbi:hypothetical protein [Streptomyces sp. 5-10]|uniref:hypothetical protein n=1 Tax=Streptomyces sp. 5-10 TaxID=878925 RepID=UPI00168B08F1|nr:hypothetical protein [Streptomyces sp. 5-10]MBD3005401.1 hypothetical protein [Streptomyces sp. 5-10]
MAPYTEISSVRVYFIHVRVLPPTTAGMGLLKERERAARQRVEALQTELREAEAAHATQLPWAGALRRRGEWSGRWGLAA